MRIRTVVLLILLLGCSKAEDQTETSLVDHKSNKPDHDASVKIEVNYSDFLGHFFLEDDDSLSQEDRKIHYDVRFGAQSLMIKKCSDFGICTEPKEFELLSADQNSTVFQLKYGTTDTIPTCTFVNNFLHVYEYDLKLEKWVTRKYISDR